MFRVEDLSWHFKEQFDVHFFLRLQVEVIELDDSNCFLCFF